MPFPLHLVSNALLPLAPLSKNPPARRFSTPLAQGPSRRSGWTGPFQGRCVLRAAVHPPGACVGLEDQDLK